LVTMKIDRKSYNFCRWTSRFSFGECMYSIAGIVFVTM
jgi:hypothetical protein